MNLPPLPVHLSKRQLLVLGGGGGVILVILILIFANLRPTAEQAAPASLTVWGIIPQSEGMTQLIASYQALRPNVTVNYQLISEESYEDILVNALAAGEGPDVVMVKNRWIPKHKAKLIWIGPNELLGAGVSRLIDTYPEVVEEDFTDQEGKIYALPLYLDTLALFYNRDALSNAGIPLPPKDWTEFQDMIPKLRKVNENGQLAKPGAAIGGGESTVRYAVDILNLLMMQNGAPMASRDSLAASFTGEGSGGTAAFSFYLQFAKAASPFYTWNDSQRDSFQSFAEGRAAMAFGYRHSIPEITRRGPFLNFSVAPMLQIKGAESSVNYPEYWGFAVAKQSKSPAWAWDFVLQTLTNPEVVRPLTEIGGYPPALRSLIAEKTKDPEFGIFARQALTARSWYEIDEQLVKELFSRAISRALSGQATPEAALFEVEAGINERMAREARQGQ